MVSETLSTGLSEMRPYSRNLERLIWHPATFWFFVHASSSIGLTILNKLIGTAFNYPFMILSLQNITAIILTFTCHALGVFPLHPIKLNHFILSAPVSICYMLLIWTSLEGLKHSSVAMVVVARNLVPFFTCLGETVMLKEIFSLRIYLTLFIVFIGSILYVQHDNTVKVEGLMWILANLAASVCIPLMEKRLIKQIQDEQTPTGLSMYRNFLSSCVFLALLSFNGTMAPALSELKQLPVRELLWFAISCLFGFTIGLAIFFLQRLVTATSIVTANTWYKLCTLIVSLLVWDIPFQNMGIVGLALSFCGITYYVYLRTSTLPSPDHGSK